MKQVPCRLVIAIMIFTGSCVNYMMRVNLSVNLVAMVPVANQTYSASQVTLNWTAYERAQVLSSYFWGYLIGGAVGGTATEIIGPRIMVTLLMLASSALTLLSPTAAKYSYMMMTTVRVVLGFASGIIFPASHVLISKWAVGTERGKFIGALIGGTIGTFIAWTLCGLIIEPLGWEWGFHLFGIIGIMWVVIYWFTVYDTPEKHPRISPYELQYIKSGLNSSQNKTLVPPYRKIFTSLPFWSLCLINFGSGWGIYFVITAAPNYLATALGYGTASSGILSALIYLVRSSCAFAFGFVGDFALKRNLISLNILRKAACVLSHILPGAIVLCMALPNHESTFYIALIIIAMGLNGSVTVSCVANAHDLTKHFVGTVAGMVTVSTTLAGMLTPFVTAYFTKDDETNQELWQPVFYIGGLVYMITGLQFLVFGSTELQPWDSTGELHKESGKHEDNTIF